MSGNQYIQLRRAVGPATSAAPDPLEDGESKDAKEDEVAEVTTSIGDETSPQEAPLTSMPQKPKPIFIAHGKDQKPLEQLKAILDQFKIPYRVAVDEPHAGRPISEKVRALMNECGSAIVTFTASGEPTDPEKGAVANLNVVFELGAASVLYGDKIILFKEKNLSLPSDFSDLGHISFDTGSLDANNQKLYTELQKAGCILVFKPTVQYFQNGKQTVKGNVDAELVLHAAAIQYANYGKAVIVTGDGDFACLVEFLEDKGKLFHVLTLNHNYSQLLKPFSQYIIHKSQLRASVEYKKTGIGGRSKP